MRNPNDLPHAQEYCFVTRGPWQKYLDTTAPFWKAYERGTITFVEFQQRTVEARRTYDDIERPAMIKYMFEENKRLKNLIYDLETKLALI